MDETSRKYTQKQWDREIGWGEVPAEYAYESPEEPKPDDPIDAYDKAMEIV